MSQDITQFILNLIRDKNYKGLEDTLREATIDAKNGCHELSLFTAIGLAAQNNDVKAVKILINDPDIDVNTKAIGYTPLMLAIWNLDPSHIDSADTEQFLRDANEIVSLLVSHPNIDLNEQSDKGRTAFDIAQNKPAYHHVAELLIEHGADTSIQPLSKDSSKYGVYDILQDNVLTPPIDGQVKMDE